MKALDKVFDTQVITGIIGDKFHSLKQRKFLMKEKTDKKVVSKKLQSFTKKIQQNLSKSKWMEHWTMYQLPTKLYDSIDFERNLTCSKKF